METVRFADLAIGDVIRLAGTEGYNDCTVYNIEGGNVHVIRPYVHCADFICTAGVITYIGEEKFSIPANADAVTLLRSQNPEEYRDKVKAIVSDIRYCLETGKTAAALEKLRSL